MTASGLPLLTTPKPLAAGQEGAPLLRGKSVCWVCVAHGVAPPKVWASSCLFATILSELGSAWKRGALSLYVWELGLELPQCTGGPGLVTRKGSAGTTTLPASGQLLVPQILFAIKTL